MFEVITIFKFDIYVEGISKSIQSLFLSRNSVKFWSKNQNWFLNPLSPCNAINTIYISLKFFPVCAEEIILIRVKPYFTNLRTNWIFPSNIHNYVSKIPLITQDKKIDASWDENNLIFSLALFAHYLFPIYLACEVASRKKQKKNVRSCKWRILILSRLQKNTWRYKL